MPATTSVPSIQNAAVPQAPAVEITTPRWLAGSVALIGLLALVFLSWSIYAVREHRGALKTIAIDSAQSVVAAERMAASLADMDANAANALLNPQQKKDAIEAYNKARAQMTDALVDAAHNITFEGEEKEIKSLAANSGIYDSEDQTAFTLQNSNPKFALESYNQAAALMDSKLAPGARAVDDINLKALETSYTSISTNSILQSAFVWIAGLLLLAVLLRVQFFLTDRMRRTLNPLCLLGTLIAGVLLLYTNHALSVASDQIRLVKQDAFVSIHSLWRAKAIAYEANAKESRYLLDRSRASDHQASFGKLAASIASDPAALLRAAKSGAGKVPSTLTGHLADELNNITFYGEREAAQDVVDRWSKYIEIDGMIRQLEQSGQHDKAVELCLGGQTGQSNWAFNGFIAALEKTIEINQKQFENGRDRGFQALDNFEVIASIMAFLTVAACFFGVLPRIREYSA